ncbi:MAG: phospholipase D-like domain-containing protein [Candidatus Macondimonas sp.]
MPASPSEPRGFRAPGGVQELQPGGFSGADHPTRDLQVLTDLTWQDATGRRHTDQTIFEAELAMIRGARRLIVADQFLYNPWRGAAAGDFQPLCARFTDALVAQRSRYPELRAVLITDPVNTAYGAEWPPHFQQLQDAGVEVVLTPLKRLADSNPAWSWLWRTLLRHLALDGLGRFPHPFKPGRVRLATYLRLLHFKANHRKTLIADEDDHWMGLVSSSNPHDGSCWHHNLALQFKGAAVGDLLASENAVLALACRMPIVLPALSAETAPRAPAEGSLRLAVLTETAIRERLLVELMRTGRGDRVAVAVFYLAHRGVIRTLIDAHRRGAGVRVLLDANHDAFGRQKNGIPNRPVAWELHRAGIAVRWVNTHGEQAHGKFVLIQRTDGSASLVSGSANFTRRNLDGFNLETDVVVSGPADHPAFRHVQAYFDRQWGNEGGIAFSLPYAAFAEPRPFKYLRYRFMEASGWSTF